MENLYPRGVEVVTSVCIVNKEKKILLIRSHKWGDAYLFPGGHVEPGETLEEAARREGEEETGLKLKIMYCVGAQELINDPIFNRKAHLVSFHFICENLSSEIKLCEKELKDCVWIEPREALKLNLAKGVKETIENYLGGIKLNIVSHIYG